MNASIQSCQGCGHPLTISSGQFLLTCPYCHKRFHYANPTRPGVVLQPRINAADSRLIVQRELRNKEIDAAFRTASYFEKATLFFIPFHEIRGARAGKTMREKLPPANPDKSVFRRHFTINLQIKPTLATSAAPATTAASNRFEYVYNSFSYLERANECRDLDIGFIDLSLVEEGLLAADQIPFDPPALRHLGVVLPVERMQPLSSGLEPFAVPLVEHDVRLIYFPVWEIAYSLHGVVFKSYLDAICGRVIRLQSLRSRRRNIIRAMTGMCGCGIAMARSCKLLLVMQGLNPSFILFFLGVLGISFLLIPYFWQLCACREMLVSGPGFSDATPIDSPDNAMTRLFERASETLLRVFKQPEAR